MVWWVDGRLWNELHNEYNRDLDINFFNTVINARNGFTCVRSYCTLGVPNRMQYITFHILISYLFTIQPIMEAIIDVNVYTSTDVK